MFGSFGQKLPPPQPAVIPSAASCSTQAAKVEGQGTSPKIPVQPGGVYAEPCSDFRRNTAIWARVTGLPGQ